jgi:hypothetical protein
MMSKLAVYDKHFGEQDRKSGEYFRQDFIYSSNMKSRFYVFFGCAIAAVFYILHLAAFGETDIFSIEYPALLFRIVVFFAAVLVAYSVLGTILYTAIYAKTQKRIENYFKLLDELEKDGDAPPDAVNESADAEKIEKRTDADITESKLETDAKTEQITDAPDKDEDADDGFIDYLSPSFIESLKKENVIDETV